MQVTIFKSAITHRRAETGVDAVTYRVIVDTDELARMAIKALENKSRMKRSGPIYVEIIDVKNLPAVQLPETEK